MVFHACTHVFVDYYAELWWPRGIAIVLIVVSRRGSLLRACWGQRAGIERGQDVMLVPRPHKPERPWRGLRGRLRLGGPLLGAAATPSTWYLNGHRLVGAGAHWHHRAQVFFHLAWAQRHCDGLGQLSI